MLAKQHAPLTDSPWFWVLIFSGMALAALLAIGPKYGGRQARLELQYQARERIAAGQAAANNPDDEPRMINEDERRDFATPDETLIPLWPLAAVLTAVVVFSSVMLFRARLGTALSSHESQP